MSAKSDLCIIVCDTNKGPSINYVRTKGEGVKPPIHFYCVLHAIKRGVKKSCKNAYVIN